MSDTPLFIDVNIPMYAAGSDHAYKPACVWVMSEIADGHLKAVIDAEIVQEVLYRFGAIGRWQVGMELASSLVDLFPTLLPVTSEDMEMAITLFGEYGPQGVKARDILHAAVMITNGLTEIVSTDRHFDCFPGIIRIDPQDLFSLSSNR